MTRVARRIPHALLAVALGLAAAGVSAQTYRLEWNYKWSWGHVDRDGSVADSDPSPTRDVFENAIGPYDFTALWGESIDFRHFVGDGGTLVLDEQPAGGVCVPTWRGCLGRTATFLFGDVLPNDPVSYRMVVSFPWVPPDQPLPPLDWPQGEMSGLIYGDRSDALLGSAMSMYFWSTYGPLAAPVPEPHAWAMGLAGLLALRLRRRRP